jgi:HEPN domain-containing protein
MVISRRYRPEYSKELIAIASGDLQSAKVLAQSNQGRPENVCYLAQQSCEKALKAVACATGKDIVHTHDLIALVAVLDAKDRPEEVSGLPVLSEFALVRRYEQGIEVLTPEDLQKIVAVADELVNWAENFLQDRFPTA